jgi:hypothetical protein
LHSSLQHGGRRALFGAGALLIGAGASLGCGDRIVRATEGPENQTGGQSAGGSGGAETGSGGSSAETGTGGGSAGTDAMSGSGGEGPAGGGTGGDGGSAAGGMPSTEIPERPEPGSCALSEPAFCDTFETRAPGGRGGDLDENLWSVARVNHKVNSSQGELVSWPSVPLSACGMIIEDVFPDQDVITCQHPITGRTELTSVFDDAEGPVFQSFRVIQPFDFADRVGRITVDIDAKTQTPGGHGWWWELVISDEPVPVPYQEFISHALMARRALVIEFEGISSFDGTTNELSHVYVEDEYAYLREFTRDEANYVPFQTEEEVLNHLEFLISQDTLEVYATDLDDMSTFRRVARIEGLGLTFTRGYVHLQHSQYNAAKDATLDRYVTYHVGSLGFDGPMLPRPRSYQVPDALVTGRTDNVKNLGYLLDDDNAASATSFTLEDVDLTGADGARINLNAWYFVAERSIQFRFNGGEWRTFEHPYPESMAQTRAVTMPVDLGDLQAGQNTLEMRTSGDSTQPPVVIANIELEVTTT